MADRNSLSSSKAFTNTSESVSRMACWKPRSNANCTVVAIAIASISRGLYGWGICLDSEPKTIPSLSRITTPIPALFSVVNLAPSQFIFTNPCWGGFHFCPRGRAVWCDGGCGLSARNSWSHSLAREEIKCGLQLGLFSRTWFCWVQINHAVTEKSSTWC